MADLDSYTWKQYEVDLDESLLAISVKVSRSTDLIFELFQFDTSIELLKRKNKIDGSSDLWMGRVIFVPTEGNPTKSPEHRKI